MQRPNITLAEFSGFITVADEALKSSMAAYVKQGRLSQKEATDYLDKHLPKIATIQEGLKDGTAVFCLAIRGYYLNSQGKAGENDRGIYDDALVLKSPDYFKTFNGNTDPRKYGFGVGMLLPGVHEFLPGHHGYGKPSGHPAFRTANANQVLPVLRDGQVGIKNGVTINIHRGGQYGTNSIACQTVPPNQWDEFRDNGYKILLTGKPKPMYNPLKYLLIEQTAL